MDKLADSAKGLNEKLAISRASNVGSALIRKVWLDLKCRRCSAIFKKAEKSNIPMTRLFTF